MYTYIYISKDKSKHETHNQTNPNNTTYKTHEMFVYGKNKAHAHDKTNRTHARKNGIKKQLHTKEHNLLIGM